MAPLLIERRSIKTQHVQLICWHVRSSNASQIVKVPLNHLVPRPKPAEELANKRRRALRAQRQQTLGDARKELILDAARAVFAEAGLDGASLREIARRAGYTPGALYSYFDSKEAIYAELLDESLGRLQAAVQAAQPSGGRLGKRGAVAAAPADPITAAARALEVKARGWFDFYARHPRDLDLGFYLVHGLGPKGLTSELNQRLNQRLLEALQPCADALAGLGCSADEAQRENAALFAHGVGVLLLQHTGRIRLFGEQAEPLFQAYLRHLVARLTGAADPAAAQTPADQPTLF